VKRTGSWRIGGSGRAGAWVSTSGAFGPIVLLMAIVIAWAGMSGQSQAEFLPETQVIDAQFARGVIEPIDNPLEKGAFGERIRAIIPDADQNCIRTDASPAQIAGQPRTKAQNDLEAALQQVGQSEIGAWLVQVAAAQKVMVCLDRATELEAHYRSHLRLLGLNARLGPAGRVVFLAHELAHVPQHPRFSNNRQFSPGDMLLLQRVREAAAEAVATRVLWQLRQQGMSAPWQEKLTTAYRDIAESFETIMADGQGVARELWATRSAFHHWFVADWRREIYDDLMLRTLARIADDPIGLIPPSRYLSDRYLRGIADYADQSFLISGDGWALISRFHAEGLTAGDHARLEMLLAGTESPPARALSSLVGETLSAVSPGPGSAEDN